MSPEAPPPEPAPETPPSGAAPEGPPDAAPPRPSRAAAYRARQARNRAPWTATIAGVMLVLVVVVVIYIATSGILSPSGPGGPGAAGISVSLGAPSIGSTTCGGTTSYPTEQFRLSNLTRTFTTSEVGLELIELGDGDIIPSDAARPQATLSSLCTGSPPPTTGIYWYGVLVGANGQNLATYTYSQTWAPVPGASFPATVTNDSSLAIVLSEYLADRGYGTILGGTTAGTPINGEGIL